MALLGNISSGKDQFAHARRADRSSPGCAVHLLRRTVHAARLGTLLCELSSTRNVREPVCKGRYLSSVGILKRSVERFWDVYSTQSDVSFAGQGCSAQATTHQDDTYKEVRGCSRRESKQLVAADTAQISTTLSTSFERKVSITQAQDAVRRALVRPQC